MVDSQVAGLQSPLRRVFFDFDQTISKCHVFSQLAGCGLGKQFVEPPFALTERGQICKLLALNARGACWTYDEERNAVVEVETSAPVVVEPSEPVCSSVVAATCEESCRETVPSATHNSSNGSVLKSSGVDIDSLASCPAVPTCGVASSTGEPWTRAALGGAKRVEALCSLFKDLRDKGVTLTIVTKGYVGAVKQLLLLEGLLDNFDAVVGNIGKAYGENDYDKEDHEVSPFEGDADCALVVPKAEFIKAMLKLEGLKGSQAVLVEDDPLEISSVRQICRSIFVRKRQGMVDADMDRLRMQASAHLQSTDTEPTAIRRTAPDVDIESEKRPRL